MIGRVYRGAGVAGLVRYLYGPARTESPVVHADPHLVGSWLGHDEATLAVLEPIALRSAARGGVAGTSAGDDPVQMVGRASRGGRRAERVLDGAALLEAAGSVWEQAGGAGLLEARRRGPGVGKVDARHLVRALEAPLRQAQRAAVAGLGPAPVAEHVWHLALRNADADRRLTDAEWAEVATDVMDRTGIAPRAPDGGPGEGGCPWIAVRHDDMSIHLVAVLAREDGAAVRLWRDFPKVRQACLAAEKRYGLTSTAPADRTAATHTTRAEREKADRLARTAGSSTSTAAGAAGRPRGGEPAREQLRRQVRVAAAASGSAEQFLDALRGAGLLVRERESERTPGQLTGYAVALRPTAGPGAGTTAAGRPVFYGGGKLAPDLSLPQLQVGWGSTDAAGRGVAGAASRAQASAGSGPTTTGPAATTRPPTGGGGRVEVDDAERRRLWARAEDGVRDAAAAVDAALREGASAQQLAEAADAAWAANDFLAATARLVEGRGGSGPLAGAARHYDRAARQPGGRPPVAGAAGTRLRQGAALLALAGVAGRHETTSLLGLLTQLQRLADRVQALREAQDRSWQARGARQAVDGLQQALSHYSGRLHDPRAGTPPTTATATPPTSATGAPPRAVGHVDREQSAARRARAGFPTGLTGLPARPRPAPRPQPGPRQGGSEPPDTNRGPQR